MSFVLVNIQLFCYPTSFIHFIQSPVQTLNRAKDQPVHTRITGQIHACRLSFPSVPDNLTLFMKGNTMRSQWKCHSINSSIAHLRMRPILCSAHEEGRFYPSQYQRENHQNGRSLNRPCVWVQSLSLDSSTNMGESWPALTAACVRTESSQEQIWFSYFWCENNFFHLNGRIKTQEDRIYSPRPSKHPSIYPHLLISLWAPRLPWNHPVSWNLMYGCWRLEKVNKY